MIMISVAALTWTTTTLPPVLATGGSVLPDYLYLSPSPPPPLTRAISPHARIPDSVDEMNDYYQGMSSGSNQTLFQDSEMEKLSSVLIGNDSGYLSTLSTFELGNRSMQDLIDEELLDYPQRDPLSIAIPMTCIYMLILLSGLIGNISTCVVIAKTNYMHTATNYYLFSLAMSDLLLLISGLPQEIYQIWIQYPYFFGEAFCVIRGLSAETSANATVLTITAFTVERFVAIVYPLKSHKLSQLSRVVRMIGIIWIVAFCLALPQAAQFGVKDHMSRHDPNWVLIKGAWCTLVREIFPYAFQISICVFFAIPMTIITVLYILIGLKLRRSRKGPMTRNSSQELNVEPRTQNRHSQSHVIRMLVAVVCCFFICWAPFHAQRLMALYGKSQTKTPPSDLFRIVYEGVTHVSGILYYISTCINPILYHIMSNKFRQAFKDTMGQLCGRQSSRLHNRTYSAISHRSMRTGVLHYTSQRNNRQRDLAGEIPQCLNCRGITPTCSCRRINMTKKSTTNNSSKFLRANYPGGDRLVNGVDNGNGVNGNGTCNNEANNTTMTLLNSSPSEKDGMIAMATLDKSQGPLSQGEKSQHPTGLRALLCRKKDNKVPKKRSGGFLMRRPHRPPSDPSIPSSYAVAILDSKGNSKTVPGGILRRPRSRTGSSGNAINIVGIHKNTCRATSYTSVESNNTISNSSLQDMDESEYTGEELANQMAELNHNLESPKKG